MIRHKNIHVKRSILLLAVNILTFARVAALQPDSLINNPSKKIKQAGALFDVDETTATGSVSSVLGETLYKTATANLTNTFYGLFSGVSVGQASGEPGYDQANITIRGVGSYNYGSYAVFVDGFQTAFNYFQYLIPSEIQKITVFKDAGSLAPFGMKGANGVIWIETKRGENNTRKAQVQLRIGMQQPLQITKPLVSADYATLYNEAVSNDNGRIWNPYYTATQLEAYRNATGVNVDWYDEVLSEYVPFSSIDASFSGGGNNSKYFVVLGHVGSAGFYDVKNDASYSNARLQQYNIRSNFDFLLFDIFEGKVDVGGRIEDRKYPAYNGAALWRNLERYPSNIYPLRNVDNTWTGTTIHPDNPVASIRELGHYATRDRILQGNFSLKERLDFITPGLYLLQAVSFNNWTRGSFSKTKSYARYLDGKQQTNDQNTDFTKSDDNGTNQWNWQQLQLGVGYQRQLKRHKITSAINYLQYAYRVDQNMNAAAGGHTHYAHVNLGGRLHYSYIDTYAAEFGFAYSGSDNYRKGNRFGFYPALSLAWILSNEAFLKQNRSIDFLKLRFSAGKSAYDTFEGGRYLYQQYYVDAGSYPTGNSTPVWNQGLSLGAIANPDIFAEESSKYNVGIDAKLFGGLDVSLETFVDKRSGIIGIDNSLSAVFGARPPFRNIGKVTTAGIEADISYRNKLADLSYTFGVNATYLKDRIDYMAELTPPSPLASKTGQSIATPFGYEAIGFYDLSDFNPDGSLKEGIPLPNFGKLQPGDIKYKNLYKDEVIDERDMHKIGNPPFPNVFYAFYVEAAFKNLDFRALFQGAAGHDVNLLETAWNKFAAFADNGNAYEIAKGRWAYYPEQGIDTRSFATYPRLSTQNNENNYKNSSFWMRDAGFLKLRNLELGYTLPQNVLEKMKLSQLRFFVNAVNLFTFSRLTRDYRVDPETVSGYPAVKSYNLGVTLGF